MTALLQKLWRRSEKQNIGQSIRRGTAKRNTAKKKALLQKESTTAKIKYYCKKKALLQKRKNTRIVIASVGHLSLLCGSGIVGKLIDAEITIATGFCFLFVLSSARVSVM